MSSTIPLLDLPVPLHRRAARTRGHGESRSFPRAERLADEVLSLPVCSDLTDGEVECVADGVRSFFVGAAPPQRAARGTRQQD